ncbi:MAG: DUF1819 family protein [Syntrophomonadaceae bacterium]|nr:DUF1819 family protein [Syntrophomonadaceae bacterium]MDD4548563.1 DUF1819 family protein [Syntrophomonadaceae bacterium]
MERKKYSAGMVKLSFWFSEFRKVIGLLESGKNLAKIKTLNIEKNIFSAPTQARAIQIFNTVSNRVKGLDSSFYKLFENSDLSTQKIIVLIAIMQTDSLFFDFVYEVYREKLIIGNNELTDSDIRIFFKDKQLQSEKVAKWKDYTLKRLGACYKTMLMEAGLIDRSFGNRKILKPILDKALEECLRSNDMEMTIRALTGVR